MSFAVAILSGLALILFFALLNFEIKRGEKFFKEQRKLLDIKTVESAKALSRFFTESPKKLVSCFIIKGFKKSVALFLKVIMKLSSKLSKLSKKGLRKLEEKKVSEHLEHIQKAKREIKND